MPAPGPPTLRPDVPLLPVLNVLSDASVETPCMTDPNPDAWWASRRGHPGIMDEQRHAVRSCKEGCPRRLLCAAWGFGMEEFGVWGGFTEKQRRKLKKQYPDLVEEFTMQVIGLVNTPDGRGGRLRPGKVSEVDEKFGAVLIKSGKARAVELMGELDEKAAEIDPPKGAPPKIESGTALEVCEVCDQPVGDDKNVFFVGDLDGGGALICSQECYEAFTAGGEES